MFVFSLWSNIESTVQNEKYVDDQQGEMSSLKQEVGALREELRLLRSQMKTMQTIVPDSGRESQDMAGIVSRESEDEKDDEIVIVD